MAKKGSHLVSALSTSILRLRETQEVERVTKKWIRDGSCTKLHKAGFPRSVDEVQHPDYFTRWGADNVSAGGFSLRFYRRA